MEEVCFLVHTVCNLFKSFSFFDGECAGLSPKLSDTVK